MSRMKARRAAFEMIFEYGFGKHTAEDILATRRGEEQELDDYSVAMLIACENRRAEFDALIEKYSVGWTVQRMSSVTAAVLRLALCELLCSEDVPTSVALNEAVELAKQYEGEECASFVNGVLGSIVRDLPPKAADANPPENKPAEAEEKAEE